MKFTIVLGMAFCIARIWMGFTVPPTTPTLVDIFKDMVHVFMGGLAVSWWHNKPKIQHVDPSQYDSSTWFLDVLDIVCQPWQWWLFWFMVAVELVVTTISRI